MSAPVVRVLSLALPLVACACSYVDPDPRWRERTVAPAAARVDALPPDIDEVLDAPIADRALSRGDEIWFALRLDEHGDRRDWFVRVEVLDPQHELYYRRSGRPHYSALLGVRVLDGAGALLGEERLEVSGEDLGCGLVAACRGADAAALRSPPPDPDDLPQRERASRALANLLRVVRSSDVLVDIVWQVVATPPLWSVVSNFGVKVSKRLYFDDARPGAALTVAGSPLPTWELPVEVLANGYPALRGVVVATEPHSPLLPCAGITALHAWHPRDPDVRFSMRLLAARRGGER